MTTRTQGKTLDSLLWDSEFYRHGSDLSDRKETSMEKGAEASDCFRKRRKVDYSTNGMPKCTEVRTICEYDGDCSSLNVGHFASKSFRLQVDSPIH